MNTMHFYPKIDYKPSQLKISKYTLPGLFGNVEKEETACRILNMSYEERIWVGINFDFFEDVLKEEKRIIQKQEKENKRHYEELIIYRKKIEKRKKFNIFSFGIYGVFAKKPKEPKKQSSENEKINSLLRSNDTKIIMDSIYSLTQDGFIEIKETKFGTFLFPTPKLLFKAKTFARN